MVKREHVRFICYNIPQGYNNLRSTATSDARYTREFLISEWNMKSCTWTRHFEQSPRTNISFAIDGSPSLPLTVRFVKANGNRRQLISFFVFTVLFLFVGQPKKRETSPLSMLRQISGTLFFFKRKRIRLEFESEPRLRAANSLLSILNFALIIFNNQSLETGPNKFIIDSLKV